MSEPIIKQDATRVVLARNVLGLPGPRQIVAFNTDFDNLSNGEKTAILKEAKEYNIPKDKFIDYYNSGRLHPLLYTKYHGGKYTKNNHTRSMIVPARLKPNDSRFDSKESERFENYYNGYL